MNTVCIYVYTKTHGLAGCSYISVKKQVCLIMTGRLVDTHQGSYDCKLNTIEGSLCSTTENKIYLFFYYYLFIFFFILGFAM